jgi:hypothetical protein
MEVANTLAYYNAAIKRFIVQAAGAFVIKISSSVADIGV